MPVSKKNRRGGHNKKTGSRSVHMRLGAQTIAARDKLAKLWSRGTLKCNGTGATELALLYLGKLADDPPQWLVNVPRAMVVGLK